MNIRHLETTLNKALETFGLFVTIDIFLNSLITYATNNEKKQDIVRTIVNNVDDTIEKFN